jgi:hypothetical protein
MTRNSKGYLSTGECEVFDRVLLMIREQQLDSYRQMCHYDSRCSDVEFQLSEIYVKLVGWKYAVWFYTYVTCRVRVLEIIFWFEIIR